MVGEKKVMMQRNLSPLEACLLNGQPLNMTEIMRPVAWDVLYIFAGSTSPVGLSAARLTGSFFRAQHTELKEKRVYVEKLHAQLNMHRLRLIERTRDHCLLSAGKWINSFNQV